jgi:O-antigen/teichoic acid export membrane protein
VTASAITGYRARGVRENAGWALAGDVATKAAAFGVVAACGRLLPVDEFARLGISLAALTVVTSLVDGGFSTLIVREGACYSLESMALLRASIRVRLPLAGLVLLACPLLGIYLDDLWLGLVTAVAAVGSALSLSIAAVFRSVQDLVPEAIQKCAIAATTFVGATAGAAAFSRASAAMGVVGGVVWLSLAPLWLYARRTVPSRQGGAVRSGGIRAAAPFGLMALATLLYYRLGIFILGAVGSATATARYTIASTIAFGLLMVPNAITTGLLPRLSAPDLKGERLETARRALHWTTFSCLLLSIVAAGFAPWVLRYGFGSRYEAALGPLVLLLAGTVVIGINGILGTVLIAARRTSAVGLQVGVSLAVNVSLAFVLVPRFGANGAAIATLATELVGLGILAAVAYRTAPELFRLPARTARSDRRRAGTVGDLHQEPGL